MGCSRTLLSGRLQCNRSNNTNKWDAQEPKEEFIEEAQDQIIPINGMLKNGSYSNRAMSSDQIIPINGMLKN